jgi:hypothetical protein
MLMNQSRRTEMTVKELMEELKKYPEDADVLLWVDGDRFTTADVDDSFLEEYNYVEINAGEDIT